MRSRYLRVSVIALAILSLLAGGYYWWQRGGQKKEARIIFISKNGTDEYVFWAMMRHGSLLAAKETGIGLSYRGQIGRASCRERVYVLV